MSSFPSPASLEFPDLPEFPEDLPPVHIRVQKVRGRKCVTLIEGLECEIADKKLIKALTKNLHCGGSIAQDEQFGRVFSLSGDHRVVCRALLLKWELCEASQIQVHGY